MARQPGNARAASCDNEVSKPLTMEQALQHIFVALPYMPKESQTSFLTMAFATTSNHPSREAPTLATTPFLPPPLAPDALHGVVRAKAAQHVQESDSAFEAKQRGSEKSSKKSGKSKGITKRYQKAPKIETMERRSPGMVAPSWCINTTPYGVPWTIGSAPVPGIIQTIETASDSTAHFHRWDSKDPSSSVRKYSPT